MKSVFLILILAGVFISRQSLADGGGDFAGQFLGQALAPVLGYLLKPILPKCKEIILVPSASSEPQITNVTKKSEFRIIPTKNVVITAKMSRCSSMLALFEFVNNSDKQLSFKFKDFEFTSRPEYKPQNNIYVEMLSTLLPTQNGNNVIRIINADELILVAPHEKKLFQVQFYIYSGTLFADDPSTEPGIKFKKIMLGSNELPPTLVYFKAASK